MRESLFRTFVEEATKRQVSHKRRNAEVARHGGSRVRRTAEKKSDVSTSLVRVQKSRDGFGSKQLERDQRNPPERF